MVTFILNVSANESIELITPNNLSELLYPDWSKYIKNEEDINIVYDMWLRELVEESSNYICKKMRVFGYRFESGLKTKTLLMNMLKKMPLNDVFRIIESSAINTLVYSKENRINSVKRKNLLMGNIERMFRRAIIEKWSFSECSRTKENPLNRLSSIIYLEILDLPKGGMYTVPSLQYVNNLYLSI